MTDDPQRLYLLAPPGLDDPAMLARFEEALAVLPVACVRLDLGEASEADWTRAANLAIEPCHRRDVALVITDHHRLVASLGLDGVHLGDAAKSVRAVRKELGPDAIVGSHCATSRHDGMSAGEAGADYSSVGPVRASGLDDGAFAETELFQWWSEVIEVPVVAEGALDAEIVGTLAPFTDFFGIGDEIWGGDDPLGALNRLLAAIS